MQNTKINIIQLVYTFEIEGGGGGITRLAVDLSEYLKEKCDVALISLGYTESSYETSRIRKLTELGINAFSATKWNEKSPYRSFIAAYKAISDYLQIINNDEVVIHSHSEFTDIIALMLKMQQKAKKILRTCHYGYKHEWKNRPLRRLIFTNFLYPLFFNVEVGVNHSITDRLNNRLMSKVLNKKAILIHEGINLENFSSVDNCNSNYKEKIGVPKNSLIIGSVGRLTEQKGHKFLLLAAHKVIQEFSNVHFIIVGDGPLMKELKNLTRQMNIEHFVSFLGSRSDIPQLLRCFDLFVLPSLWEGLPISLLESMASRVPVITTAIPGCADVIENGKNGILVPPKDPITLSQAIIDLLASEPSRVHLSYNGYKTVQKYSMQTIANQYMELYLSLGK